MLNGAAIYGQRKWAAFEAAMRDMSMGVDALHHLQGGEELSDIVQARDNLERALLGILEEVAGLTGGRAASENQNGHPAWSVKLTLELPMPTGARKKLSLALELQTFFPDTIEPEKSHASAHSAFSGDAPGPTGNATVTCAIPFVRRQAILFVQDWFEVLAGKDHLPAGLAPEPLIEEGEEA
jgi:hypothetical protein